MIKAFNNIVAPSLVSSMGMIASLHTIEAPILEFATAKIMKSDKSWPGKSEGAARDTMQAESPYTTLHIIWILRSGFNEEYQCREIGKLL